jgi:exosortase F-associated protein
MLRELTSNKLKIVLIVLLVVLLAAVRGFEDTLFYDPFSLYFKGDYLNLAFPEYSAMHLFWSMGFRYWVNSAISLSIIYILFSDWELTKFAAVLYLIFFIFLIATFFLLLRFSDATNNFVLFYIRRFLIQPLLLLLFVPAFYFQKQQSKK